MGKPAPLRQLAGVPHVRKFQTIPSGEAFTSHLTENVIQSSAPSIQQKTTGEVEADIPGSAFCPGISCRGWTFLFPTRRHSSCCVTNSNSLFSGTQLIGCFTVLFVPCHGDRGQPSLKKGPWKDPLRQACLSLKCFQSQLLSALKRHVTIYPNNILVIHTS